MGIKKKKTLSIDTDIVDNTLQLDVYMIKKNKNKNKNKKKKMNKNKNKNKIDSKNINN